MPISNLGTITLIGRILQVHNAVVDEVFLRSSATGYISIFYANPEPNKSTTESLRLNVSTDTVLLNSSGHHMLLSDIKEGMLVDSLFSPIKEKLIPPQSDAYLIVARSYNQRPLSFIIDRIARVDVDNSILYIGDPNNTANQIRVNVSNMSTIRDRYGDPVPLYSLCPDLLVEVIVTHANFQTGIPSEAEALHIQIL